MAPVSDETVPTLSTRQIDISRARGLLNARTSLLDDASYEWDSNKMQPSSGNQVLIRFVKNYKQVAVRIDFDSRRLSVIPEGGQATLVKKTADGWRSFIARCVKNAQVPQSE